MLFNDSFDQQSAKSRHFPLRRTFADPVFRSIASKAPHGIDVRIDVVAQQKLGNLTDQNIADAREQTIIVHYSLAYRSSGHLRMAANRSNVQRSQISLALVPQSEASITRFHGPSDTAG